MQEYISAVQRLGEKDLRDRFEAERKAEREEVSRGSGNRSERRAQAKIEKKQAKLLKRQAERVEV